MKAIRKRFIFFTLTLISLFITCFLHIVVQKKQLAIGGGINRIFFFLFINAHVITLVILLYSIIRQSIKLFLERRKEEPGSVFRRNLLFSFSIFSVIPTILIFFIGGTLITNSIDTWFESNVGSGLEQALKLHRQQTRKLRSDLATIAGSLAATYSTTAGDEQERTAAFTKHVSELDSTQHAALWHTDGSAYAGSIHDEIRVWRSYRRVNNRSMASLRELFLKKFTASHNKPFLDDFYGSLYHVQRIQNPSTNKPYLQVVTQRYPDHIRFPLIEVQTSLDDYEQLKRLAGPIYWHYFLIFLLATLLILFLSVWCAFYLARGISTPIQKLLNALTKIKKGNWNVSIPYNPSSDLNSLEVGFNQMTNALRRARDDLERNYQEMLAVLEHLNTAVFIINNNGRIVTYNRCAKQLVSSFLGIERFKNKRVSIFGSQLLPLFSKLVRKLDASKNHQIKHEITHTIETKSKTLILHMNRMQMGVKNKTDNLLVVVEDITDIVKINKIKTWQLAARQMAHEIKNPLTPIQLATQRLRRKYRKLGGQDAVINECTDTILGQVHIIRNLVSHFAEFGKLPKHELQATDINQLIHQVVALYQVSYPDITFTFELEYPLPHLHADKKNLKRALINLLDNSIRVLTSTSHEKNITIKTKIRTTRNQIELTLSDNGPGIPYDVRNTLFLPQVSTSKKNMGLGLAIVHENIAAMGGSIQLIPSAQGASFQIRLPI